MTRSLIALTAVASLLSLAGCAAGSGESGEVKLGVDIAALQTSVGSAVNTTAGSALTLTRVRVLVGHAKIGYTHEQASGDSADVGPIVVDLTADEIKSGAHRDFSLGSLPSGTYGGAEVEIEPLDTGASTSDPALADFVSSSASLLVEGTYQGASFQFAGHFLAEQGTDGDVTVSAATPVSLAMSVDPSAWFRDSSGAAVDPSVTAQHGALAVAICKTLDTEPALTGGAAASSSGPHGGGPQGGGGAAHCVEP